MSYVVKKMLQKLDKLEETNSEWILKCPICSGKIKVSKNHIGKYLCVTENCKKSEIRKKLNIDFSEEKDRGTPYPMSLNWSNSDSIIGVDKKNYCDNVKIETKEHLIYYNLDDNNKVVRDENKKEFYTYFKDKFPPLFNEHFLENKYGTVVFLEGEKCANFFTYLTCLLGLSIPASCWSIEYIEYSISRIKPNISSIIFFPDNDEAGKAKAEKVEKIANDKQIKVKILKPYKKKYNFNEGDDVEELSHVYNVKHLVMKSL